jgi:hypothetical protein
MSQLLTIAAAAAAWMNGSKCYCLALLSFISSVFEYWTCWPDASLLLLLVVVMAVDAAACVSAATVQAATSSACSIALCCCL